MFTQILSKLHAFETTSQGELVETQRNFLRHAGADAEVMIAGRAYAVRDWSFGGVLFDTPRAENSLAGVYFEDYPAAQLAAGDEIFLSLRFHVLGETVEMPIKGRILRMGSGGTVARFAPLSAENKRKLSRVLDLQNAKIFLESQQFGESSNSNTRNH